MSYIRLVLLAAAIVALAASHVTAYRAGAASERTSALTRSVEALRARSKTNEAIKNMDDAALCRELGGVWSGIECQ